jgi:hypothetical protein
MAAGTYAVIYFGLEVFRRRNGGDRATTVSPAEGPAPPEQ